MVSPFGPFSEEPKGDRFRSPSKAPKLLTQEEVGKGEEGLVADEARGCPPGGGGEIAEILLKNSEILRVGSCCWFNKGGAKKNTCLFVYLLLLCCFWYFLGWYCVIFWFGEFLFMTGMLQAFERYMMDLFYFHHRNFTVAWLLWGNTWSMPWHDDFVGKGGHRWSKYNDIQWFHITSLWLLSNLLGMLG